MINRWMKGSAVALFALGMFACSSPSVGNPATLVGGDTEKPSTPSTPSSPSTPSDPSTPSHANPAGTGETKTITVDNASGAIIALDDGTQLTIPAGALPDGVTEITVTSSVDAAPSEYTAFSPKFVFGPDGIQFNVPLTVKFPVSLPAGTATSDSTVMWSRFQAVGYDMLPTTWSTENGKTIASAQVHHFSSGFVGAVWTVDPNPAKDPYAE